MRCLLDCVRRASRCLNDMFVLRAERQILIDHNQLSDQLDRYYFIRCFFSATSHSWLHGLLAVC